MFKIKIAIRENKDKLSLNGNILTQNGIDIDLTETTELLLTVDKDHKFLFTNGNLLRFYDIDSNGEIDINELKLIVDHINNNDLAGIREELKSILDKYLEDNTMNDWYKKGESLDITN